MFPRFLCLYMPHGPQLPEDSDALQSIAGVLAENGFTEQDIWDANPALAPVLSSLRSQMDSMRKSATTVMLSIDFSHCEDLSKHGFTRKVYKVDPNKSAWQTVALIFTKIGPALASSPSANIPSTPSSPAIGHAHASSAAGAPNHRRYGLRTPAGNLIDDNAHLSSFGLGSIFHSWDLVMFRKTAEQFAATTTRPTSTIGGGTTEGVQCVVTFLPGDGPMFAGISKLTKKVLSDTPTGQLIANFCKRYNISEPERFVLTSTGDLTLSRNQSLGYYGLGKKFDQMTVKLVQRKDLDENVTGAIPTGTASPSSSSPTPGTNSGSSSPSTSSPIGARSGAAAPQMTGFNASSRPSTRTARHSVLISPEVAWTQLDDHLSVREAQAVILDLDKQLADSKHSLQTAMQQRTEEREALRKLVMKERESYKELETQHDQLRQQARTLVDVYVTAKERSEDLIVAKSTLEAEVSRLQGDITNMRSLMGRARDELMTTRTESATKTDQINGLQGEILAQKVEREELKLGLEVRITALSRELQEETGKVLALYSEQISMQDEIERQQSQLEKIKIERSELEDGLAAASQREAQLSSEATQLKKEVSSAQYSEQQAKAAIETTAEENALLTAQVETLTTEKRASENATAAIKATLASKTEQYESELSSAKTELETVSREKAAAEAQFSSQLKVIQEAMMKAGTSGGDGSGFSAYAIIELDTLKSQKQSLTERLEASTTEATTLKRQLAEAKSEASTLREASAAAEKENVDVLDGLKRQFTTVKEQLSVDQKSLSEAKQAQHELTQELTSLQTQHASVSTKAVQLAEDLRNERADNIAKREAAAAAEKEVLREINGRLTKITAEKTDVEKQLKESEQKAKDTQAEKIEVERQLSEASQTVKEQATLISEQKTTIIRLETPPPAPFIAATLRIEQRRAQKNGKGNEGGSLESEILGIKDTLLKIDTSALSKKKDFSNENLLSNLLMNGLEKRFKAGRSEDEVEDLASDDLYIPNDNEEEWR